MEAAALRSSRGFEEEDDDDREFGKRESPFSHKDLGTKIDGKGSGTDDLPSSPRSKHSAMEQRRRNKINDRFQILGELIPHSDQKRDKASLLLEVIEYIRFLQEKIQKYETSYSGWNHDDAKLMPWGKFYCRSLWKNAQNNQVNIDGLPDASQVIRNSSVPASVFSGQYDESNISVTPAMLPNPQNPTESELVPSVPYKTTETATGFINADNMPSQAQSYWLGLSSPADCAVSNAILNEQEELIIDEGTFNASATYSQGLLTTLTQALQNSGVDISQANISVQINLGKRASNRRPVATVSLSEFRDPDESTSLINQAVHQSMMVDISEESSQASRRQKADNN
ncbi:transcription factor BIM2-like isoform X1 [Zingiber officinale]|uniref:transcription factor BIM2-like isoform X1 n=1 Tax=Zingiber officinale TaxID=94328 RepID=UPI001C4D7155|nr:transcription factor BIM2-like isoform X1 [Zingiber officinale]